MRLHITTYMISNSSNEKLSCLLPRNTSMQSYIVQSKMQFPGEWTTDLEITAASCLLNTKIHVLNFYEWALYSPNEVVNDLHQEESILINNVQNHLKWLKRCKKLELITTISGSLIRSAGPFPGRTKLGVTELS